MKGAPPPSVVSDSHFWPDFFGPQPVPAHAAQSPAAARIRTFMKPPQRVNALPEATIPRRAGGRLAQNPETLLCSAAMTSPQDILDPRFNITSPLRCDG